MKTTYKEKLAILEEIAIDQDADITLMDGYEDALIGYTEGNDISSAVYDYDKCINILITRDKMSEEEAIEYFSNTIRTFAYINESKPIIMHLV